MTGPIEPEKYFLPKPGPQPVFSCGTDVRFILTAQSGIRTGCRVNCALIGPDRQAQRVRGLIGQLLRGLTDCADTAGTDHQNGRRGGQETVTFGETNGASDRHRRFSALTWGRAGSGRSYSFADAWASITPPPSTSSPSYRTTNCPGVTARWGDEKRTSSPLPLGRTSQS